MPNRSKKPPPKPTAASSRPIRTLAARPLTTTTPTVIKTEGNSISRRGRPRGSGTVKIDNQGKKTKQGNNANKTIKATKTNSMKQTEAITIPKSAPQPKKLFNDNFKTKALEYEVEKLVGSRIDRKGNRQYLVKWVG